ncbi:MAG: hypothetical protein ABI340_03155 [Nitrososphaera sp.]
MDPKKKRSLKIIILLSIVWFASALPVPFLWSSPTSAQQSEQFKTYLEIAALISIPFIGMAVAWTLKPELATRG